MKNVLDILIGLLALSFLTFFHELGHFVFAKLFKVQVLSFSIGMGPVLLHKTINGTDYRISLLPFGGYCGLSGEKDFQKAIDEKLNEIPKTEGSLYNAHPLKRAMIAFAGPMFNFILAIIAFTVISMVGYKYASYKNYIVIPTVDQVAQSPARDAGLLTGDKIIKINNDEIYNFRDIQLAVSLNPKEKLNIVVDRNGEILNYTVTTLINKEEGNGILGVFPDTEQYDMYESKKYSLFPAIYHGAKDTVKYTFDTIKSISILFKGVKVSNVVSGPARITSILGDTFTESFKEDFRIGLYSSLSLISFISISLGFINLLPIPLLDGSLILFSLINWITKKEIPPKVQIIIQYVGIVIIGFLFILGITGDIRYFIDKWRLK